MDVWQRWPSWFTQAGTAMRSALSARLSYAHCQACAQRRPCRYDIRTDQYFCSEDCWFEARARTHAPDADTLDT